MGIAAYYRGNRAISWQIWREYGGLPHENPMPPVVPATPRPEGWGDATRGKATAFASGLAAHWRAREVPFSAADLADAIVERKLCGRKTALAVANNVLAETP